MKSKRRFFSSSPLPPPGQEFILAKSETNHLKKVLRLKEEDTCSVIDTAKNEVEAKIIKFSENGQTLLKVIQKKEPKTSSGMKVRVLAALLQKGKTDDLVEKLEELGADEFWAVETKHSGYRLTPENQIKVVERWRNKIHSAMKQSGRLNAMEVHYGSRLSEILPQLSQEGEFAVFHPAQRAISFQTWQSRIFGSLQKPSEITLCFGPEGGFTDEEIKQICRQRQNHIEIVRLGSSILRADTAIVSVVGAIRFLSHE